MWSGIRNLAERISAPAFRKALTEQHVLHEHSIADLKQDILDRTRREWQLFSGSSGEELNREDLGREVQHTRALILENPLGQRAVDLMVLYVFGQGYEIKAEKDSDDEALQAFVTEPRNRTALFGAQGLEYAERELDATGNLFFLLTGSKGQVGPPQVRMCPLEEFHDIATNPNDRQEPWFYRRECTVGTGTKKSWHPDWRHAARTVDGPPTKDDIPIDWDAPVAHYRVGGYGHWAWGFPKIYAAAAWATSYKNFLEDLATVIRALSRLARTVTMDGTPADISTAAVALRSSLTQENSQSETNPPPAAGSTWVQNASTKIEAFKAGGMHVDADSGRRLLLMFAAAMGFPETFFADLSNSNLATAKALDRPTELLFLMRQTMWKRILGDIGTWGISQGRTASSGLTVAQTPPEITVTFPPILEHDIDAQVGATVAALTLGGKPLSSLYSGAELEAAQALLRSLGIDDPQKILDKIEAAPGIPATPQEARWVKMTRRIIEALPDKKEAA